MTPELLGALGAVVVAAVTALGSLLVARTGGRATREGQRMTDDLNWRKQLQDEMREMRESYDKKIANLEERIVTVESESAAKSRHLDTLGGFVDELALFELYGSADDEHPEPPDGAVAEFYDRARWLRIAAAHNARLELRLRTQQQEQLQQ